MAGYVGYKRTIQLDFDYDKIREGVPKVNQQMALLNSEFNKTSSQVQATGNAFDKLMITNQKLSNQVQLQKDKVRNLEKELEKLTTAENKNERAIASKTIELNNAQAQLTKLKTAYTSSNEEVEKSKTLYGQAKLELENFRLGAERTGVNLDQLKGQFVATTAAIIAFVSGTSSAYMSYEEELIQARNLMDENVMSYGELNNSVKSLSNTYGILDKEMAKATATALSSGVSTADSINFMNEAAKFSKATFTDLNTIVDLSTSIMNSYGYSISELPGIYDQLINTQKQAKVSWEDYNSQIGNLSALGSKIGVSLNEINAALILQTQQGIASSTALTNLKGILSAISNPTSEAARKADELGIKFDAATLKSKGLDGVLKGIVKGCKGNNEAMATLFGSTEAWTAATILASNGGKDFQEVLSSLSESSGMLDNSLKNVEETTSNKWNEAINRLKNSAVELGESMAPIVNVVAKIIDLIAAIPAPVTLAVISFFSIAKILSIVSTAMIALGAGGGVAAAGLTAVGLAGGISLPVILAIAAAIALVVAMIALLSKSDGSKYISNAANSCNEAMSSATTKVNNMKSRKGYATGTNYVSEDGYYTVGENGPETIFMRRGQSVYNDSQTRKNSDTKVDMTETNNLLKTLCSEFIKMQQAYTEQPNKILRLQREGGYNL
jgi:TP901 family phage tail tape measure protein